MDEDRSKRGSDPNKSASSEQGQIACKCRRNRLPSRTIAPDGIGNGHSMAQSWCNMESAASSSRIKISLKSRFHRRSQAASQRNPGNIMAKQLHYGSTAKVFHWLIVALLIVQPRLVHAGHSSWDGARRCDDVPYFLWDHHPC